MEVRGTTTVYTLSLHDALPICRDIVSLGMVKDLEVHGGRVAFTVELTTPACPLKEVIERECREAVRGIQGVETLEIAIERKSRRLNSSHANTAYAVYCQKHQII